MLSFNIFDKKLDIFIITLKYMYMDLEAFIEF